jgi:3-isopropylmalate/(R)-2-methylmalate dehydratase small subunit
MASAPVQTVSRVTGKAIPVHGNDIDTDRVIPARYLRSITFEGLGDHVFEDDRKTTSHPFDEERFSGASVLLTNANFGCGSSREHAPQALARWGIQAIVGESFAEIFAGNCTAMGIPCLTASHAELERLMKAVEDDASAEITVDIKDKTVTCGDETIAAALPNGVRIQLLEGAWDATGMLLEGAGAVAKTARRLPYVNRFQNHGGNA